MPGWKLEFTVKWSFKNRQADLIKGEPDGMTVPLKAKNLEEAEKEAKELLNRENIWKLVEEFKKSRPGWQDMFEWKIIFSNLWIYHIQIYPLEL
ncbi:MAG: hypothetical protein PHT40_02945 [Patescibacteria group bacterium]|nr:hypothetical protein [Patescibacteria group bacterium]